MNRWILAGFCLVLAGLALPSSAQFPEALSVTEEQNGESLTLVKGQQLNVTLPANPSTGYTWTVPEGNEAMLALHDSEYTPGSRAIGGGGHDTFHFTAQQAGTVNLNMIYGRSWETEHSDTFSLTIQIVHPDAEAPPSTPEFP